jgi:hypothetical protein
VAGIETVGLGAALGAAPGVPLGRFDEVGPDGGALELLDDEEPAGRSLEHGLDLLPLEACKPGTQALARRGDDAALLALAHRGVKRVEMRASSSFVL